MMIPNKFNGYSRDGIRLYNDPATVTVTLANMGEGVAVAEALAASAAAAAAATTAAETAAAEAAAQAAAQQAGQAGIMQGGASAGAAAPAGVPGLGAPVAPVAPATPLPPATPPAPATPLEPAGINPVTPAGTEQAAMPVDQVSAANGINPAGQDQVIKAFQDAQAGPINTPELGKYAGEVTELPTTPVQQFGVDPTGGSTTTKAYVDVAGANPPPSPATKPLFGDNAFGRGIDQAMKLVSDTTKSAYEGYKSAPAPLQYLSAGLAAKQYLFPKPEGAPKNNYKRTPYSGLSPHFVVGGPSPYLYGANGGLMNAYADGGPVEQMSNLNAIGGNTMYPMANIPRLEYANPVQQRPVSENIMTMGGDSPTDPYTGQLKFNKGGMTDFQKMLAEQEEERKEQGMRSLREHTPDISGKGVIRRPLSEESSDPYTAAVNRLKKASQVAGVKMHEMPKLNMPDSFSVEAANGGIMRGDLGGYSDGGRLLKGPGDGVSDSIPAVIGNKQPARLADGEFVVPARIVSELGNGSTEAGARQLYAMMERIQKGRRKSVGKGKVAVDSKAKKHLPA